MGSTIAMVLRTNPHSSSNIVRALCVLVRRTDFLLRVKQECEASDGRVRYVPKDEILAGNARLERNLDKQLSVHAQIPTEYGVEWRSTRADALFQLDFVDQRKRPAFFVEIDKGTEPVRRSNEARKNERGKPQTDVYRKYQIYDAYWRSGRSAEEFGFPNFYVLFLTDIGEQRVRNVVNAVRDVYVHKDGSRPGFRGWLFTHIANVIDSESALTALWTRGDGVDAMLKPMSHDIAIRTNGR